ncbi:MAG: ABC transporter ATP-binding protein [Candidatus Kaiserbacteria bacterium]|nr:ABC transporter ATP-binding protein [Candidatus Kaiserbacteria bacterium]
MKDTISTLLGTFGRYRWHIIALVVFGVASSLLEGIGINAVIPLMSFFIGGGVGGVATDFITGTIQGLFTFLHISFSFRFLLIFIFCLFIARAISVIVFGYIRGWINADFLGKESEDVMRRVLLASWSFSLKQKIGTVHNTLVRDVQQTGNLLDAVAQTVQSFSGFLMYLLVAINISPIMTVYTIGGGAVLFFLLRPFLRRAQRIGNHAAGVEKKFSQFLSEHIIGMKSIKAAGVERAAIAEGNDHIHLLRRLSIRQSFISTVSTSFFQPSAIVIVVLLFLLTYHSPGFSVISFAASLYLIQKIFTYLESGQGAMQSINGLLPYAKNIATFKRNLSLHRESADGDKSFILNEELTFKKVSFSYDEVKQVLNGVDFKIRSGETVGLIGPSGAGKTSVADILLRLFKPNEGELLLDGVPSEEIALEEWRKHVGYVSQDVFLLNSTIEDNIRFYNKDLTAEDIENATKQANIYDFITELPEGFKTMTGDRGVMLSGGQRQRIALARALASRPKLLILDEATSALDSASEKLIQESIRTLHGSVTVLIIAHRLSTIEYADRLLVLDHGKIIENGTPQEFLAQPNSYFSKHHGDNHG